MKIELLVQDLKKFLGQHLTINWLANFNHISKICKTASNKLHALARVSHYMYMDEDKRRILFNFYFLLSPHMDESQQINKQKNQ